VCPLVSIPIRCADELSRAFGYLPRPQTTEYSIAPGNRSWRPWRAAFPFDFDPATAATERASTAPGEIQDGKVIFVVPELFYTYVKKY